jgi:pimeloyl-ACP methyl ester carboxylesterase
VNDTLVDEWWEMWLHNGNRAAILDRLRQYRAADIDEVVAQVSVPVLLLWGERDPQTPLAQADELKLLLKSAPSVDLDVLKGVGHMAVQEAPQVALDATLAYIEGRRASAAR